MPDARPIAMNTFGSSRQRRAHGLVVLAVVTLAVAGCGSSAATSGASAAGGAAGFSAGDTGAVAGERAAPAAQDVQARAVVSTGRVSLVSTDVAAARTRVDTVLVRYGGQVADENTVTDRHGTVASSDLVVRVPSADFADAMRQLAGVATLRSSSRKAEDVTTQVIDVGARIAAQRAGVARLRKLVAQTGNLRALLAVERELSAGQGELQSLKQQRAYLADQTSLATITVDISRQVAAAPTSTAGGFVGGLRHGWHALVATGTGVLLTIGLLLPFAVVVALVGVPAWFVLRRLRRGRAEPEAPAEA